MIQSKFGGSYSIYLSLAMKELHAERKSIKAIVSAPTVVPVNVEKSHISAYAQGLISDLVHGASKEGKRYFTIERACEIESSVYLAKTDAQAIALTIHTLEKTFMNIAKKYTFNDIYMGVEGVYMDALIVVMEKASEGTLKSLIGGFKFAVLNSLSTEKRRRMNNEYISIEGSKEWADGGRELDEKMSDVSAVYNRIPVEEIIKRLDYATVLTETERKILNMFGKGMTKTQIDKAFGQRMDRKFKALEEKIEAYYLHGYSNNK